MRHTTLELLERGEDMKDKLTPKQEKFIQNIIKGMSQRQAYRDAFNPDNTSDKTVDEKACRLFNEDKIQARYSELMKELEDDAIMNAKQRMEFLTKIITDKEKESAYTMYGTEYKRNASFKNKLAAIDLLNKMNGDYKISFETKTDINIKIE
jgi:phage terminase small subunit